MFCLVALSTLAQACSRGNDADLAAKIAQAVDHGNGTVLTMEQLTRFSWDRLHVFPPYTTAEQVDRELGVSWASSHPTGIEARDDISLLVFMSGGQVVRFVTLRRGDGDFAAVHRPGGYARADAVFTVSNRGVQVPGAG
jgi:hypothetical protein